ncbi:SPOR domain-containing protein [Pelagibacterium limicola]|uniref:SPOR domain-containing protein n=1 Tax=Pelagibacterium limicola TaxID=2791022 RepID=UPI0018AFFFC5|nr:SPOR domain-containing protein [Pelagibacterium limicola]
MDTPKQNPAQDAQDSDDLIAELARLVAQDARSQSANSAAYTRVEPRHEPVRSPEVYSTPEPLYPEDGYDRGGDEEASEPVADDAPAAAPEPAFDFGFLDKWNDDPQPEAQHADRAYDPIADLIADAEQDAFVQDDPVQDDQRGEDEPARAERDFDDFFVGSSPDTGALVEPERQAPFEVDTFFGESDAHAQQNSRDDRDPLSEIEALIGEAARVSALGTNGGRRVRSSFLGTADHEDFRAERAVDAAESAILAAAAASGAQIAEVHPYHAPESDLEPEPEIADALDPDEAQHRQGSEYDDPFVGATEVERPQARRRAGIILPVVAGTAILAVLTGGYFMFFATSPVPSEAPVLTAEAGEIKEVVENTATVPASESVIFNEIDGNTVPPEDETLVSRDQTNGVVGANVGSVIAPEEGETMLANRPVRTVTVRPDGTIVSSDGSIAGSSVLPVERPDVPAVPNSTLTADPIGEAIVAAIGEVAPQNEIVESAGTVEAVVEPVAAAESPIFDPASIPRPVPRPNGLGTQSSSAPTQQPAPATQLASVPAQQDVAPASAPQQPTAAPTGVGAWVQLSSQRSEEAARAGIPELQSRYGALFNGAALDVSRVDLGERGVYYRVRLPQPTMADANTVCNSIKGQGGDCFVLNN